MNWLRKFTCASLKKKELLKIKNFNCLSGTINNSCNSLSTGNTLKSLQEENLQNSPSQELQNEQKSIYLHRNLDFNFKYAKPREVWVENFDTVKEEKRGLVELHPKIFGTIPRLDLIYLNVKWQNLYNKVVLFSAKTRAEINKSSRKPHPQKKLGKARQGSIKAPHFKGGGSCHGPRNPTSYFYNLQYAIRVHGLTSTFSAKFAQDDIHVVENIDIPTDDHQFISDLIEERSWGSSVLIADVNDIMPRNITVATDKLDHVTLMPVYGLNVYSMLKHDTLVLTLAAVNEIEEKILTILNSANPFELRNMEKNLK